MQLTADSLAAVPQPASQGEKRLLAETLGYDFWQHTSSFELVLPWLVLFHLFRCLWQSRAGAPRRNALVTGSRDGLNKAGGKRTWW